MPSRIALGVIALAASLAAGSARAENPAVADNSFIIEGFGGWQSLRPSFNGVANAAAGHEGTGIIGADVLGRMNWFGLGLSLDKTTNGNSGGPWAGAILAGFLIDPMPSLRLEALGELGRRAIVFGDMFASAGVTFVGFRPGVSLRLLPSAVRLGVSIPIRWNTSGGSFSSPDYGFVARVGFEFP
jgi:hypothetical protein